MFNFPQSFQLSSKLLDLMMIILFKIQTFVPSHDDQNSFKTVEIEEYYEGVAQNFI